MRLLGDKLYYTTFGESAWIKKRNFLRRLQSKKNAFNKLSGEMKNAFINHDLYWAYNAHKIPNIDPFREAQWLHLKIHLPSKLLVKVDRCSMQHSLETRAPFLSHLLVQTMLDMSTNIRNPKPDWFKGLFRQWLKDKIEHDVLYAPKRGFSVPRNWNPVLGKSDDERNLKKCVNAGIVNSNNVAKINKRPKRLWKYMQIENALNNGYFSISD